ncbi:YciI family protein [Streptomyces sp. NPDC005728]|uniref:YciI family protein n=1 Tax=Streptomyces sp. NPDC005728 TaxID=3157054 RepID=UPI0034098648
MKYLVMVQGTQADYEAMRGRPSERSPAWTEEQLQAMYAYMGAINDDLAASGELVDAQGLAEPARTRLVGRGKDGETVIADGPYRRTEELMAGYWVVDCASLERVTEIAERVTRCPGPEGLTEYPVVIRPIMDGAGDIGAE